MLKFKKVIVEEMVAHKANKIFTNYMAESAYYPPDVTLPAIRPSWCRRAARFSRARAARLLLHRENISLRSPEAATAFCSIVLSKEEFEVLRNVKICNNDL